MLRQRRKKNAPKLVSRKKKCVSFRFEYIHIDCSMCFRSTFIFIFFPPANFGVFGALDSSPFGQILGLKLRFYVCCSVLRGWRWGVGGVVCALRHCMCLLATDLTVCSSVRTGLTTAECVCVCWFQVFDSGQIRTDAVPMYAAPNKYTKHIQYRTEQRKYFQTKTLHLRIGERIADKEECPCCIRVCLQIKKHTHTHVPSAVSTVHKAWPFFDSKPISSTRDETSPRHGYERVYRIARINSGDAQHAHIVYRVQTHFWQQVL